MIGHEAVRPHLGPRPSTFCSKHVQVEPRIAILKERRLAAVAALRHRMRKVRNHDPCDTCYAGSMAEQSDAVELNILSPEPGTPGPRNPGTPGTPAEDRDRRTGDAGRVLLLTARAGAVCAGSAFWFPAAGGI